MWSAALLLFILPGSPEAELDALLRKHAERASAGDADAARIALEQLEAQQRAVGLRNLPFASAFLIQESKIAQSSQDSNAEHLAEVAAKLSPDMPAAHALRLELSFANPRATLKQRLAIAADYLAAFFSSRAPAASVFAYAALAAFATLLCFVLIQLIKYTRPIGWWLPAVALAPPFFNMGAATSAVLVLSAIFSEQTPRERRASLVVFFVTASGLFAVETAIAWSLELDRETSAQLARDLTGPFAGKLPAWGLALIAGLAAIAASLRGQSISGAPPPKHYFFYALVPGVGDMTADRPLAGALLFFLFACALASIYWLEGIRPDPLIAGIDRAWITAKLFLSANLIAVLLLIAMRRASS